MEQTKADLWALKTTPTVTSFFRLLLVDGHSPEIVKAPVTTGRCGLGWSFIFQAMNGDTNETLWGGTTTARQTLFTISLLATYHISSLDKLLVNVEADNSETKLHVSEISLSDFKARPFVSILSPANFTGNITIEIHVGLPKTFSLMGDPSGGAKQRLHRSLAQSLLSGGLGDVRFALFKCGKEDGEVKPPKILYASSSLIRGYSAFIDNLLSDTEEREVVTVGDLAPPFYIADDYASDSDFESDSDVDEYEDRNSQPSWSGSSTIVASQNQEPLAQSARQKLEDHQPVIFIKDTAYSTWKALMFYLYTRDIRFKPLTSSPTAKDCSPNVSCSPKSMFRLAAKIGSEELQTLSLKAIICEISKDNVIEELFSSFTSMYPQVQQAQVKALIPLVKEQSVKQKLVDKMKDTTIRGVPHCGAIVALIVEHLVELGTIGNKDPLLGDKGNDEDDNDGADANSEDTKESTPTDNSAKKRKDKDGKPSESDKVKAGKGDKNESKLREGDRNKDIVVEGYKNKNAVLEGNKNKNTVEGNKNKYTPVEDDKTKHKHEKFSMKYPNVLAADRSASPADEETDDNSGDGFTFVGRSWPKKGSRFDVFQASLP